MSRFAFVGPSYKSQSISADNQAAINFYPEVDESGAGNAPIMLYPTPGLKTFVDLKRTVQAGVDGLSAFDKASAPNSGVGTALTTAAVAPSSTPSFAIFGTATINAGLPGGTWSTLTGMSNVYKDFGNGPFTGAATTSTSNAWAAIVALFKVVGASAPTLVQTQNISGAVVGPQNLPFTNPVTAGNPLIVVMSLGNLDGNGASGATWTSSRGDVFTRVAGVVNLANTGCEIGIYFCPSAKGGATTIESSALNLSSGVSIGIFEYAGGLQAVVQNGPVRGEISITGRTFVVSGGDFDEVLANGTYTNWGTVENDAKPVTMAATPQQLLLASAGTAYVFDLQANTLTAIDPVTFGNPVAQAGVCDDFFLLTIKDSKEFFVSAPLDATDWVTNGSAIVSVFPDNIVTMAVVHRQIFFASDTKAVFYYDSGNIFPFDVIPGSDMDQGAAAENATSLLYNTVFWVGADERGHGVGWMANGYTPQRVTNHAIETAWQSYSRIDDAVALTMQDQGHYFWIVYFPTAGITWAYDVITGMWHQRGYWLAALGRQGAARYQNHTFNFGKHLVGDWASAKVYEAHVPVLTAGTWTFCDDNGNVIVRERVAPHISKEQKYQTHFELQIFVQPGLGPIPPLEDGDGNPRAPEIQLQWSDDSGQTWSNIHTRGIGQAGQYKNRSRWLRLGTTRDRIYRMRCSDPVGWRIVDAYLQVQPGTGV